MVEYRIVNYRVKVSTTIQDSKAFLHIPMTILALYPLPKRTNSRKFLFISISCISIFFVYKLSNISIIWWHVEKFHIIPTRNSQDMDNWNIYLHFLGHVRLGDSTNKCACAKIKNRNIRNFGFYIELFLSIKHFK